MIVDYSHTILNYIASIRNYFGLESSVKVDEDFSKYINEVKPERIYLFLNDAMGTNLINKMLPEDSFLRKNIRYNVQTLFPTTTTAVTTSVQCGKMPNETGWLGWEQYFKEVDDIVVPFRGTGFYTEINYGRNFVYDLLPFKTTTQELNEKGIPARDLLPNWAIDGCETLDILIERMIDCSKNKDYKYIYAYWPEFDALMHKIGVSCKETYDHLNKENKQFEYLATNLKEKTLIVFVADHGQIDIEKFVDLKKEYGKYFYRQPAIESRASTLYVKEELKEEFEKKFKEQYGDDILLLTKKEVIDGNVFGTGKEHPRFREFLGDYLAISKDKSIMYYGDIAPDLKGQHAGIHEDELIVPIITYIK